MNAHDLQPLLIHAAWPSAAFRPTPSKLGYANLQQKGQTEELAKSMGAEGPGEHHVS